MKTPLCRKLSKEKWRRIGKTFKLILNEKPVNELVAAYVMLLTKFTHKVNYF